MERVSTVPPSNMEVVMRSFLLVCVTLLLSFPTTLIGQNIELVESVDPFTDEDRSFILAMDDDGEMGVGWKCLENGLRALVAIGKYYGGDRNDNVRVRYRFDEEDPVDYHNWSLAPDNRLALLPARRTDAYTRAAMGATQLVIEVVDPLDGEAKRSTISLVGFTREFRRLSCAEDFFPDND